MEKIKISIIMPINKVPIALLQDSLHSALNQSIKNFEIICVLDGLNFKVLEFLKKKQKSDKRIKILCQTHKGSASARNKAIKQAEGEFISFLDADDYYPADTTLEEMYINAINNNVKIAGGKAFFVSETEKYNPFWNFKNYKKIFTNRVVNIEECQFCWGYWNFIYSKNFIVENKLFFPKYLRYQDPPFLIRAINTAKKYYALDKETYVHRVNYINSKWSRKMIEDYVSGIIDVIKYAQKNKFFDLYSFLYKKFITYDINFINEKQGIFYLFRENTFNKLFKIIDEKIIKLTTPDVPIFKSYKDYLTRKNNYDLADE